jgi:hypothetical protein
MIPCQRQARNAAPRDHNFQRFTPILGPGRLPRRETDDRRLSGLVRSSWRTARWGGANYHRSRKPRSWGRQDDATADDGYPTDNEYYQDAPTDTHNTILIPPI